MSAECHQLTTRQDGTVELAYLGAKPWHGLGQVIPEDATIEQTAAAAGMNFTIYRSAVEYGAPTTERGTGMPVIETITVPDRVVLYRSDTLKPLSVVSTKFQEVQPLAALEFFRSMVEAGGYQMETAGTMRGGARLFAMVKVAKAFELAGGDQVETRLLFATACDGTMATHVKPTTVRVVCRNTLNLAMARGDSITVRHNTRFDPELAKARLRAIDARFDAFARTAERLAAMQMTSVKCRTFLADLLPQPDKGAVEDTRGFKAILALFDGQGMGAELASARGTMWGVLNAVTEYVDHGARARSTEARQESALFGAGESLKQRALVAATT